MEGIQVSQQGLYAGQSADRAVTCQAHTMQSGNCEVERRNDGAVLVRVHSADRHGRPLPDAVFAFRIGDPQYDYWNRQAPGRQPKSC